MRTSRSDTTVAPSQLPFRWRGKEYRIVKAGIVGGDSYAQVAPRDSALEQEMERRIADEGSLKVYLGAGYQCFREDHPVDLD